MKKIILTVLIMFSLPATVLNAKTPDKFRMSAYDDVAHCALRAVSPNGYRLSMKGNDSTYFADFNTGIQEIIGLQAKGLCSRNVICGARYSGSGFRLMMDDVASAYFQTFQQVTAEIQSLQKLGVCTKTL